MGVSSSSHAVSSELTVACSAKINWFLNVSAHRPDDYHDLQTVMQCVDLYDVLSLRLRNDSQVECIDADGCCNCDTRDNIIFRAAKLLQDHFNVPYGVDLSIKKNIPVGAGLGGGSSNAAATLSGLVSLWNLSPQQGELSALAVSLGADVPFFLGSPLALCTGIGEITAPRSPSVYNIVLWKPAASLSTRHVYQQFDRSSRPERDPDRFLEAYDQHDILAISQNVWNNLADASCECMPELNDMIHHCRSAGALTAWISGSGPTIVSLCSDQDSAQNVFTALSAVASPDDILHCGKTLTG